MNQQNQHQPTAADFFAQPHDDEDPNESVADYIVRGPIDRPIDPTPADWQLGPLHVIPESPMERVASALEALVELHAPLTPTDMPTPVDGPYAEAHDQYAAAVEQAQLNLETLADTEAKLQTISEVLTAVEEALGKSTAKPALAAKAVIDAWKNPQVESVPVPLVAANPGNVEGHTRTQTDGGPDFCRECSEAAQEWRQWPCAFVAEALGDAAADAIFVPATVEQFREEHPVVDPGESQGLAALRPEQPAHDAPVEEWREYARSLGFAGPEIDKANRSQVRTALGLSQIAQPSAPTA